MSSSGVPARPFAVAGVDADRLGIAAMVVVVVAAVAEVDAADEGDVPAAGPAHEHELLMVAPGPSHAFVEQELAAGSIDGSSEMQVLACAEVELIGVRPPYETPHVDASAHEARELGGDFGARPGEPLVAVAHARCCRSCRRGRRDCGHRYGSRRCRARPARGTTRRAARSRATIRCGSSRRLDPRRWGC